MQNAHSAVRDLVAAHVELEGIREGLEGALRAAKEELTACHAEDLAGAGDGRGKRLAGARQAVIDLEEKISAVDVSLVRLRERMKERIPTEARERVDALNREGEALGERERKTKREFLRALAQALILEERLIGPPLRLDGAGPAGPSLRLKANDLGHYLDPDEYVFLSGIVEEARLQGVNYLNSFRCKRRDLSRELELTEKLIEGGEASAVLEAERLLREAGSKVFRAPEPEPEERPAPERPEGPEDGALRWGLAAHY